MQRVRLAEKLTEISQHWAPHIVAEVDGHDVKVAKLLGDFVWHSHEGAEEMFLVLKGRLRMDFRDRQVELHEGDLLVVPRGVEHKPFAAEECEVLLIERRGIVNTGDVDHELTVRQPKRI